MNECLEILSQSKDCPADETLVQQVRLQLIVEKVAKAPLYNGDIGVAEYGMLPPAVYARAPQSQLQGVKDNIATKLQPNFVSIAYEVPCLSASFANSLLDV
jgi:hypothetical protein